MSSSSTFASQSSSTPLQTSGTEAAFASQVTAPSMHAVAPAAHVPDSPVEQTSPPSGLPSSIIPSQSSSARLQRSAAPK